MPRSEQRYEPYLGNVWRLIEGQYRPATRKITDSVVEQSRLETLLDATKPTIPEECAHLDYQFSTPFRYGCYPRDSRFRRAGPTPGVYYAAEDPLTAAIESAWGSVAFFRASPGTPLPTIPRACSAILAEIRAPVALDLTAPGNAALGRWTDPVDYGDCLDLADQARARGGEAIRYTSVRDPLARANVAVLTCAAFARPEPLTSQTWHLHLTGDRVVLTNESLRQTQEYRVGAQALEPA
ncbi:RES family NAD+ phosphorylase [Pararhodobacter marinus]|uniref:RES family NAD+ phosphorylase n=1 Tax=Pararhodobacter marinus TaxID=2184063 RepID=UPI0035167815